MPFQSHSQNLVFNAFIERPVITSIVWFLLSLLLALTVDWTSNCPSFMLTYRNAPLQNNELSKWTGINDIKNYEYRYHMSVDEVMLWTCIWNKFITQEERTCNVIWTHFLSEKQTYHCSVTDRSNFCTRLQLAYCITIKAVYNPFKRTIGV